MQLAEILARIELRMEKLGTNPTAVAKASGRSDAVRNLQRAVASDDGRQGISTATINALAPVLKTTPVWLFAGAGPEELEGEQDESLDKAVDPTPGGGAHLAKVALNKAAYGGLVEAGAFRSVDEFDDLAHQRVPIFEMVDAEFPDAQLVVFDVSGDSMNALKPHALLEGFRVVCLDFESLKNRAPVRDGMVVVVEQTINGGQLRERSVKQMEIYRDRTEFCPRSSNPRHKPIVVPRDVDPDDGREVTILAIVRRVTIEVKV